MLVAEEQPGLAGSATGGAAFGAFLDKGTERCDAGTGADQDQVAAVILR